MKKIMLLAACCCLLITIISCGKSYDEKRRLDNNARRQLEREDSLALKVAALPTLDCLPLFIAVDDSMFANAGVDVRLKMRRAQIDCDTLIRGRHVEGVVSDLMRTERLRSRGLALRYVAATNAYWQMISNRKARIKEISQLSDKMIAITRYSATDYFAEKAIKAAKPKYDVFQIQVNDVVIRLKMLLNNEMDAVMLTEPQATTARLYQNPVLMDSRDTHINLGVIAFREACWKDSRRQQQISTFIKVYNQACDSINTKGMGHYKQIISKYTGADAKTIMALPKLLYDHAKAPNAHDVSMAQQRWK